MIKSPLACRRAAAPTLLLTLLGVVSRAQSVPAGVDSGIVTDRPDVTEASIVVPKGSLQFENGMTWTRDHERQALDLSETLIRLGISAKTEIRMVLPNYFSGLSGPGALSGFDDFALGMKRQIGPLPGGVYLSVIAAISLPTGGHQISTHGFDPFVKFPWSKDLKAGWSIGGMQSVFWFTQDGKRNPTWEPTVYLEKEIAKPMDVFLEYAGDFPQAGGSRQIVHFGTAYRISPAQQVDCHFGFGVSHAAPTRFVGVGYSFRIDKLWVR